MPQFKNTVRPVVMSAHVGKILLKLSITDMYAYCIFVEPLRYKVLIFCLYGLFGRNSLLMLTTLPYNPNSAIQGGCQLLLKISITDLYAYWILFECLRNKVLILCLCRSFGGKSLLIWTNLSYNNNSAIQGSCQLLLKLYINNFYAYCIFVEYLRYKVFILCLCGPFGKNSLLVIDINYFFHIITTLPSKGFEK